LTDLIDYNNIHTLERIYTSGTLIKLYSTEYKYHR